MQKWIMTILFYGACAFGVILLMVNVSGEKTGHGGSAAEPLPTLPAVTLDVAAAEAIYKQSCLACHGDQLQGALGPNLQAVGSKMSEEQLYKLILNGKGGMPGFEGSLTNEEVANVSLWLATHK